MDLPQVIMVSLMVCLGYDFVKWLISLRQRCPVCKEQLKLKRVDQGSAYVCPNCRHSEDYKPHMFSP